MFIIENTYLVSQDRIDELVPKHRSYMQSLFDEGLFIVMGPKEPRDGGIIISTISNRDKLVELLENEPLVSNQYVSYRLIEFKPTVVGECYKPLISEA